MSVGSGAREGRELGERNWAAFFEDLNKRIEDGADFETTIEVVADPTALAPTRSDEPPVRLRRARRDGARARR